MRFSEIACVEGSAGVYLAYRYKFSIKIKHVSISEMIQATGDTSTQWILDFCNGIVKEGSIHEDWKSSVVLPIYKGKGDPME